VCHRAVVKDPWNSSHTRKASHQSSVFITSSTICSLTISRPIGRRWWCTRSTTWLYYWHQQLVPLPLAPTQREQESLLGSVSALVNMEQMVAVGAGVIQPVTAVRDLGVLLDQELSMTQHITKVTSSCFYQLRRLRQISRPVGQELVAQLVHSFVLSRLDYVNSVLCSLTSQQSCHFNAFWTQRRGWFLTYGWKNTWHQLWGSSTGCPSTVERTSNCAPDALNLQWSASDVFIRHGACRRRQPDDLWTAIRRHCSIHWVTLSHWDRQACVLIRRSSRLERSSTVTPLTRSVIGNILKHIIVIVLSGQLCMTG